MGRKAKILIQTTQYLDHSLDIIRKLEEPERLIGGAKLMIRIIELNQEYERAFYELRGLLGLETRPK